MAEFTSRGVGNAGLTTGIIGTSLGAINSGLLGNLFGNNNCNNMCSENYAVNRYELGQEQTIAKLQSEIALRDATTYTLGEVGKLRDYFENKFNYFAKQLSDQAVYNATNTATISCMAQQIAQLQGLTKIVIPITNVCPQPAVATTPTT
jgi:hypothetical protein